jgi:dTDP-4-amino-4,6-dideoxygalactose transaminase
MAYSIPLFDLNYDEQEERAVLEVLRSGWISMGPKTEELESAFAAHAGCRHAIAVSNCTTALHLCLTALGLGSGDEVIVPSMTFVATVNAVGYVGAVPIFGDIVGTTDFSLDPVKVKQLITPRTKAVIPMHYAGFPCDMEALENIAREHNLFIIGDAAHAPATRSKGKHVGAFGDAACFSFFANKNIACGEGGMIVTNRAELAQRIRLLRSHGMTSLSFDRARGHAAEYDVVARGFNYRLDDIHSALALSQLKKLRDDTAVREKIFHRYLKAFKSLEQVQVPYESAEPGSSYHIFPLLLREGGTQKRNALRKTLAEQGIQTSVHYPPAHRFEIYSSIKAVLPKTERVADHEITLPLFAGLTEAQQEQVIEVLQNAVQTSRATK